MLTDHPETPRPRTLNHYKEDVEPAAALATSLSQLQMTEVPKPIASIPPSNTIAVPSRQPQEHPTNIQSTPDSDDEVQPFGESDSLFDEHADSEDEEWIRTRLLRNVEDMQETGSVSCPGCFSVLSMQVQGHERHEGQFRAVFVMNCRVVRGDKLRVTDGERGRRKEVKREAYRPVACEICGTEVGVLDGDGVYHFCNVFY